MPETLTTADPDHITTTPSSAPPTLTTQMNLTILSTVSTTLVQQTTSGNGPEPGEHKEMDGIVFITITVVVGVSIISLIVISIVLLWKRNAILGSSASTVARTSDCQGQDRTEANSVLEPAKQCTVNSFGNIYEECVPPVPTKSSQDFIYEDNELYAPYEGSRAASFDSSRSNSFLEDNELYVAYNAGNAEGV